MEFLIVKVTFEGEILYKSQYTLIKITCESLSFSEGCDFLASMHLVTKMKEQVHCKT